MSSENKPFVIATENGAKLLTGKDSWEIFYNGVEKELPSGLVVRLRPVDSGQLLTDKSIPESLMRMVRQQLIGIQNFKDEDEVKQETADEIKRLENEIRDDANKRVQLYADMRSFGEAVALNSFIHPKIVEHATKPGEIQLNWIPTNDLIALGQWPGVPFKELESFRFKTFDDVESVQSSEGDLQDTEQDFRDEPVSEEPVSEEESVFGNASHRPSNDPVSI